MKKIFKFFRGHIKEEKRIYYIPVGNIPEHEVEEYIRTIARRFIEPINPERLRHNLENPNEDYFIYTPYIPTQKP